MIGQYLSQTNESATVAKTKIFSKLNKALVLILRGSCSGYFHALPAWDYCQIWKSWKWRWLRQSKQVHAVWLIGFLPDLEYCPASKPAFFFGGLSSLEETNGQNSARIYRPCVFCTGGACVFIRYPSIRNETTKKRQQCGQPRLQLKTATTYFFEEKKQKESKGLPRISQKCLSAACSDNLRRMSWVGEFEN